MEIYLGPLVASTVLFGGMFRATGSWGYALAAIFFFTWVLIWGYKLGRGQDSGHK